MAEDFCYENVEAHAQYSKMLELVPNRGSDVDLEIERANEVIKYLPYWSPKLMYVILPDFEFN